jgi:hypothetical protein
VAPAAPKGTDASLEAARTLFAPSRLDGALSKLFLPKAAMKALHRSQVHGEMMKNHLRKRATEIAAMIDVRSRKL